MKNSILKNLFFGILIGGNLILPAFALAQICPDMTTVTGTTVNFVGELTDMGGDAITYVWFEYGKTVSLGQKTSEKALSQAERYCFTVSGLDPSTTYYYRAAARNSAGTSYGEIKSFTTTAGPWVDIKANNSDGPITIPYNSSANLTWQTGSVDSCYASGDWSGSKSLSGSQSTGNLTSSKTYTLTCSGSGGTVSDSVRVNVTSASTPTMEIKKMVRNLSDGTAWSETVYADPGEVISFSIKIRAGDTSLENIYLKDTLPEKIRYRGNLKIDGISSSGDITSGLFIGNLAPNQEKTITFDVDLLGPESFAFGETQLTNRALAYNTNISGSDTAQIIVSKKAVLGIATAISTGLTNNFLFDSFLIPLIVAFIIVWLFKSRILKFEEWLDERKEQYREYKSKKILKLKIAKIKAEEFLKNKLF